MSKRDFIDDVELMRAAYCSRCGGFIAYDTSKILLSIPLKYKGTCGDCGNASYGQRSIVDRLLGDKDSE